MCAWCVWCVCVSDYVVRLFVLSLRRAGRRGPCCDQGPATGGGQCHWHSWALGGTDGWAAVDYGLRLTSLTNIDEVIKGLQEQGGQVYGCVHCIQMMWLYVGVSVCLYPFLCFFVLLTYFTIL